MDTTVPITWPHVIGWLVTLVGFVLAAKVALMAQEHRRTLDDGLTRRVLRDAVQEGLSRFLELSDSLIKRIQMGERLDTLLLREFHDARVSYDRNKDNMVLWEPKEQRVRIQRWFRELASALAGLGDLPNITPHDMAHMDPEQYGSLDNLFVIQRKLFGRLVNIAQRLREDLKLPKPGDPEYFQMYEEIDEASLADPLTLRPVPS